MQVNEFQQKALAAKEKRNQRRDEQSKYDWRSSPSHMSGRNYLTSIRKRAKENNREFNLTEEWITSKLKLEFCEATGLPFEGTGRDAFGRTFDRKDSTKGYTIDNCWVTCWIYNRCKLDGTHDEVMRMARALVGN